MSQNPYAAPTASSDFGSSMPDAPARTSVLAIISLVCSLICFVPGLPALGSLLGVFSLIGIAKSGGRVKGNGLAIAGIVVGLLFSVLQIGLALGANSIFSEYARMGEPIRQVDAGDTVALRASLATDIDSVLTDADIAAFKAGYEADAGEFDSVPRGIMPVMKAFSELGDQMQPGTTTSYTQQVPVPATFANGKRVVWIAMAKSELNDANNWPAFENVGVMLQDGSILWLVDPDDINARLAATNGAESAGNAIEQAIDGAADDAGDAAENAAEDGG